MLTDKMSVNPGGESLQSTLVQGSSFGIFETLSNSDEYLALLREDIQDFRFIAEIDHKTG